MASQESKDFLAMRIVNRALQEVSGLERFKMQKTGKLHQRKIGVVKSTILAIRDNHECDEHRELFVARRVRLPDVGLGTLGLTWFPGFLVWP
jgi:hypothetical protein